MKYIEGNWENSVIKKRSIASSSLNIFYKLITYSFESLGFYM